MLRLVRRLSRRPIVLALVLLLVVAATGVGISLAGHADRVRTTVQRIVATPEPDGRPVTLDSTLYLPAHTPAPAVLLAHGFGGSKSDLDSTARALSRDGFVVLAYTARGFGRSGGLIHLDSLDYEVKDARLLVDWLAARPEVAKKDGNPQVAVGGSSYGGALALMLAGTDPRIDAVFADITWNDLAHALFPNGAGTDPGVWKKLWAGYLFQAGIDTAGDPSCGRFSPDVCRAYQRASSTGRPDAAMLALLHDSSPATVIGRITAPVLLSQGEQDSLFPLSEADANARAISAHGTPVRVIWRSGGHDGGGSVPDSTVSAWFTAAFAGRIHGTQPFEITELGSGVSSVNGQADQQTLQLDGYPSRQRSVPMILHGGPRAIAAPAGGVPAAITSGPGLGDLTSIAAAAGATGAATGLSALAGQNARYCTSPLTHTTLVAGSSSVQLSVSGSTDATLFVSLHDVDGQGVDTAPSGLVTAVRITKPGTVPVSLPWIVYSFPAGHRACVDIATTDSGYYLPPDARTYTVAVAGPLHVATLATPKVRAEHPWVWVAVGGVLAVLAALFVALTRPRRLRAQPQDDAVPVVVDNLVKEYGDGYRAVDGISFEVRAGQVVGLLGPNGAGKTTALRVLVGLIRPTAGEVRVFGQPIRPGSAVLTRVGAFIEGPGFLPHLTGRQNLHLYWAATGRPRDEAHLDIALDIAGLGSSVDRRVKSYSQGMKQRLGIAQAMLGLPEVLVLDEPTNGLDPPQIAEMREVMSAYARTGRTVIVSSHLLAEVEQTCTHVVVMTKGRVVAAGTVAEIAGRGGSVLAVKDPVAASAVLSEAGIESDLIPARRALEDVFLDLVGEHR